MPCVPLLVGANDVIRIVSLSRDFSYVYLNKYPFLLATATYEPIVNEVQVPIIKRHQCDEWLDNLTVSDGMICAGYEEGGKDACQVS